MEFKNIKDFSTGGKSLTKIYHSGGVVWSEKLDDLTSSPGPKKFLGGDLNAGFFGEISSADFITGKELCDVLGLTTENRQFEFEPWLKFSLDGKILFVAKKAFISNISYKDLASADVVTGSKKIGVRGHRYKVRLLKGKADDRQTDSKNKEGFVNKNSEWNRLMMPIHKNAPRSWAYPNNVSVPTQNWRINYTDEDLHTHYDYGNGSYSWCQEYGESDFERLYRGGYGVSYSGSTFDTVARAYLGYRPCLEFIE